MPTIEKFPAFKNKNVKFVIKKDPEPTFSESSVEEVDERKEVNEILNEPEIMADEHIDFIFDLTVNPFYFSFT